MKYLRRSELPSPAYLMVEITMEVISEPEYQRLRPVVGRALTSIAISIIQERC